MATNKIDVTVARGTVNDGKKDHGVGDHLKMSDDDAGPLIKSGVLLKGKVDVGAPRASDSDKSQDVDVDSIKADGFAEALVKLKGFTEAVAKLESGNAEHWTNDVAPDVNALKSVAGFEISAEERDKLWDVVLPLMG